MKTSDANEIFIQTDRGTLKASILSDNSGIKTEFTPSDESDGAVGKPGIALRFDTTSNTLFSESYNYGSDDSYKTEPVFVFDSDDSCNIDPDEENVAEYQKRFVIYSFNKDIFRYTPLRAYNRMAHALSRATQMARGLERSGDDWLEIHCENDYCVAVVTIPDGKVELRIDVLKREDYPQIYNAVYPINRTGDEPQVSPDVTNDIADKLKTSAMHMFETPAPLFLFMRIIKDLANKQFDDMRIILVDPLSEGYCNPEKAVKELQQLIDEQESHCLLCFSDIPHFFYDERRAADFIKKQISDGNYILRRKSEDI